MMAPLHKVMLTGLAASSLVLSQPGLITPFGRVSLTTAPALMLPMPTGDQLTSMGACLSTTARCLRNATLTCSVPTLTREVTGQPLLPQVNTGDKKVLKLSPGIPNAGTGSVEMPLSPLMILMSGAPSMMHEISK